MWASLDLGLLLCKMNTVMVSLPKLLHDFVGEEFGKGWAGGVISVCSVCHELRRLGLEDPFSSWLRGGALIPRGLLTSTMDALTALRD